MTAVPMADLRRYLRHPAGDAAAIGLSIAHGTALVIAPSVFVVAIGMWWSANTIAHHFIHRPFFRFRMLNRAYSAYLTLLLGVPQTLWKHRHLDHHFPQRKARIGTSWRAPGLRRQGILWFEVSLLIAFWASIALVDPRFFVWTYLPGWLIGLLICHVHGYYEHAGGTTSHYSRLYNFLCFNDGLHVEHHARPSKHWSELRRAGPAAAVRVSAWPPMLRWMEALSLNGLERIVLRHVWLQTLMVRTHARAFAKLLPHAGVIRDVTIVGGGLFPRTPLVLRTLLPAARLTVLEAELAHLRSAERMVDDVDWRLETFAPGTCRGADLLVVPLAYVGDRARLYAVAPAGCVIVHDWIWRPRGESVVVAWWLLKRLNLVRGDLASARPRRPAA